MDILTSILDIDGTKGKFKEAGLKSAWYTESTKGSIYIETVTSKKYVVISALSKSLIPNLYTTSQDDIPTEEWGVCLSPPQRRGKKGRDRWITVVGGPLKGEVGNLSAH